MYNFLAPCGGNLYISDRYFLAFTIFRILFLPRFLENEIAVFCIRINLFGKKAKKINTWTCMHGHFKFRIVSRKSKFIYLILSCPFGDSIQ